MSIQYDPSGLSRTTIPRILCPRCGTRMRLASAETASRDGDKMIFDCKCGFEYQMAGLPELVQTNAQDWQHDELKACRSSETHSREQNPKWIVSVHDISGE